MPSDPDFGLAARLTRLLSDLSYREKRGIAWARVARDIEEETGRPFPPSKLRNVVHCGTPLTLEDAVQVAEGLGVELNDLAYDGGIRPTRYTASGVLDGIFSGNRMARRLRRRRGPKRKSKPVERDDRS